MEATFSPSFSIHSKSPSPPPTTPKKGTINPPLLTPPQPPRHTCTASLHDFSQKSIDYFFLTQPSPPLITFHRSKRPLTQYFAIMKSTIYNSHCIFFCLMVFLPTLTCILDRKTQWCILILEYNIQIHWSLAAPDPWPQPPIGRFPPRVIGHRSDTQSILMRRWI